MSKVYILTHLGLGDMITTIGMIQYLTTIHEEVMIATKHKKELEYIYKNEKKVTLRQVESDNEAMRVPAGYTAIKSGIHKGNFQLHDVPFCFYRDSGVPEECFWSHFDIPDTPESKELYQSIGEEYIVVHNNTSKGQLFSLDSVKLHYGKDIRIIDLNKSEGFAMRPLVHYKDLLINASALYLSNSCIFCLAVNLELNCDKCYYISRYNFDYSYFYKNVGERKRKRFTKLMLK